MSLCQFLLENHVEHMAVFKAILNTKFQAEKILLSKFKFKSTNAKTTFDHFHDLDNINFYVINTHIAFR